MSLIWKKIRDGRDSSKQSRLGSKQAPDSLPHAAQPSELPITESTEAPNAFSGQTSSFVTPAIERLFFPIQNPDVSDPLKSQPQFVLTLQQILDNLKTRRYFLSHLEGSPSQVLAAFWIDVHNLQQCGLEILAEQTLDGHKQKPKANENHQTRHHQNNGALDSKTSSSCGQYGSDQTRNVLDDRPKFNGLQDREIMQIEENNQVGKFKPDKSKLNVFISDISNANFDNLNANDTCDNKIDDAYSSNHNVRNKESNSNTPKLDVKIDVHCDKVEQSSNEHNKCEGNANFEMSNQRNKLGHDTNFNSRGCITNKLNDNNELVVAQNCDEKESNLSGEILQHLIKEVWRLFERYIAVDSDFKCPISDKNKTKAREKINKLHLQFDPYCFKEAQDEAFSLLKSEVPGFLSSDYHLRHQLDLLSYSSPTLPDMLYSQAAFPYFVEYLDQKRARPLLEFWMMASNFREQLETSTGHDRLLTSASVPSATPSPSAPPALSAADQNQEDAMVIYDKYFSLQASHRLGFSDELRCFVEGNICQEQGPDASCFDVAVKVCLYVLQTRFLPDYLRSSLYDGYISDLLASVKNTTGERQRTASSSTCSSEVSSSTAATSHNTLLAMDTSGLGRRPAKGTVLPSATTNMRIDARLISDPDSLWRRPNKGGLSCGSINPLGRFESLLQCGQQHVTARPDHGKLAKTLRRLANRDDDKVRLEQAYSVAAAIVSDVTRVTLDARNSPATPYHPANPYDLANLRHPQHPLGSGSPAKLSPTSKSSDDFVPPLLYSEYFKPPVMRGSNSNLSIISNVSSTSDLPQSMSTLSSPAKSVMSIRKSSSNYNFSDITDGLFGPGSHGLAHSYSLASFDLATDLDPDFPDASAESEVHTRKYSKT